MTEIPGDLGDAQGDNSYHLPALHWDRDGRPISLERWALPALHWDRDGQPISLERWAELLERGEPYRRVAATWLGDGPEAVQVSTVWIGINYGFGETARPLIFETMVFGGNLDGECRRTPDVHEAQATHDAMVVLVRADLEVS